MATLNGWCAGEGMRYSSFRRLSLSCAACRPRVCRTVFLSNSLADVQVVAQPQDENKKIICFCAACISMWLFREIQFKGDLLEFQLHKYCDLSGTYLSWMPIWNISEYNFNKTTINLRPSLCATPANDIHILINYQFHVSAEMISHSFEWKEEEIRFHVAMMVAIVMRMRNMYPFPVQYSGKAYVRGNTNSVIDDFNADVVILGTLNLLDESHNVGKSMSWHPIQFTWCCQLFGDMSSGRHRALKLSNREQPNL